MTAPRWAGLLAFVVCLGVAAAAQVDHETFLKRHAGFSADDIRHVERGDVVAHSLDAAGSEVAIAASAIIRVPIPFFLERFEEIATFKRSSMVLQIGRFSKEPSAADLAALTLPPEDVEALRSCTPGRCDVKLDGAGIARLRGAADVQAAFREHLAEYVARYLREGNPALMTYDDQRAPRRTSEHLRRIVGRMPFLADWPELRSAVADFRGVDGPLRHFIYWAKEKPAGKASITVTHAVIHESPGHAVIATKQLYSTHYTTGSLGVMILADRGTPDAPRTQLIYMNRTHTDLFEGFLTHVRRPVVRSRARSGAENLLSALRTRLENEWRASDGRLRVN